MAQKMQHDVLQSIIDHLPSAVSMFDAELQMVACNRQLRTLLDFPDHLFEPELPSLYDLALFNARRGEYGEGEPGQLARNICERALSMQAHVFERARPNGVVLEVRGTPLPGGGFVTIYTDITERKRAEQKALRYGTYLNTVINALPQGVTVIDENLVIQLWNQSFERLLQIPPGLMKPGITFEDVFRSNAQRGEYGDVNVEDHVREATELARRFLPHRMIRQRPNGTTLEVEGQALNINGKVSGFITTYTDVTELSEAHQTMKRMALHDPLTGLANRHQFDIRFKLERDRQQRGGGPLSLVMVDLDHFKSVNDQHGHLVGDECLRRVAQVLKLRTRSTDLVSRFGGEEFLMLLPDTDTPTALAVVETMRHMIATVEVPPGIRITASFGVTALYPGDLSLPDEAIAKADIAVYQAKSDGRNCVRMHPP